MMTAASPATDRFGNRLDAIVRYARGGILKSSDEEVVRMLARGRSSASACVPAARRASTTSPA